MVVLCLSFWSKHWGKSFYWSSGRNILLHLEMLGKSIKMNQRTAVKNHIQLNFVIQLLKQKWDTPTVLFDNLWKPQIYSLEVLGYKNNKRELFVTLSTAYLCSSDNFNWDLPRKIPIIFEEPGGKSRSPTAKFSPMIRISMKRDNVSKSRNLNKPQAFSASKKVFIIIYS